MSPGDVVVVGPLVVAPAEVDPHALGRDPGQGPVERLHLQGHLLPNPASDRCANSDTRVMARSGVSTWSRMPAPTMAWYSSRMTSASANR